MKKLLNKSVGLALALLLFVSLLIVGISKIDFSRLTVKAEYSRDYSELTDKELDELSYRATPGDETPQITVFTHGLGCDPSYWSHRVTTEENGKEKWIFGYQSYSMVERLRQRIGEDKTTVMTASVGFGKKAVEWANTKKTRDEAKSKHVSDENDYIGIENPAASLRSEYHNFDKLDNDRQINLYGCNTRKGIGYDYKTRDDEDSVKHSLQASDVNKHIIIVFESIESEISDEKTIAQSNDYVYAQLEYILDSLSYQYCQLTGELPTYNLIGHSRGGITNLQYAMAHPNNVASIYSMGTPYSGSTFGSTTFNGNHILLSLAGYNKDTEYIASEKYPDTINYNPGVLDILDEELNDSYKNYWNKNYSQYYSHITFRPIGTYVTLEFFLQVILEFLEGKVNVETGWGIFDDISEDIKNEIVYFCKEFLDGKEYIEGIFLKYLGSGINLLKIEILEGLFRVCGKDDFADICRNIKNETVLYPHIGIIREGSWVIKDDLFIDLDSQIAKGYEGAEVVVKLMNVLDGKNADDRKCTNNVGVAHNLETQNSDIVDYVVNSLNFGIIEKFSYEKVEGGYCIKNLNIEQNGTLIIPESYNGQAVVAIDRLSRDINIGGTESYHSGITEIIIPKTVKEISGYAFYGMNNLKTVSIDSGSILESIGEGAFMNCKSLAAITLPKGVNKIGTGAFAGCSSLTSFLIGANVSQIGANAFFNCDKLTAINVATGNTNYSSQDGVLFDYNKTQLLQYPYGKAGSSYTVPASVSEIGEWAFFGNKTLTTINLNQVNFVRKYAFCECTNLASITGSKVKFAEEDIAFGTSWLNNANGDMVVLGKALLEYRGSAKSVNLQGIASIAPFAFSENTTLEKITIDNELINIGQNAFYQCENLKDIYLNNTSQMVFIGTNSFGSSNEERTIYVPHNLYTEYRDNEFWKQYADKVTVHQTKILFNSNGGNNCEAVSVEYLDYIGELPVPQKDGYVFLGWYDNAGLEGNRIEEGLLWESLEDTITLYAKYRQKSTVVYSINYHPNGGTVADDATHTYTSDDEVILSEATKKNYIFKGWYYDEALKISAGNGWGSGEKGNKDLYAKWEGIQVKVTVNQKDTVYIEYGSRGYLPKYSGNVEKGYEYIGWAESKSPTVRLTDENGRLLSAWNRAEDTNLTLVPMFNPITYTITFILPDGVEEPGNPDTYTIETATFTLKSPTRNGYIFDGWYENGKEISSITKGSTGNKTIESRWNKLYTISFYANGGRACNSITGTYGEKINLPYSYRTGCTGKWSDGYAFGASYTIVGDKTFSAIWKSNQYKIYFTIFGKVVRMGTYTYFDDGTAILWEQPYSYVPEAPSSWYTFDGWYKKSTFTSRVTEVIKGETGDRTVYGRWKYNRPGTFTITDDGVFKQSSDWINLKEITGYTLSELKAQGYKSITFNGELTVWQKDDGYKYMQIYDGTGSNAKRIHEWWIDHRDGKTKKVWQLNNDGSLTINLDALTNDTLCFRYTASGAFSDTWYNSNCMITVKSLNK